MNANTIHNVEALKIIATVLRHIIKNPNAIQHFSGICGNIYNTVYDLKLNNNRGVEYVYSEMKKLFCMWPEFSGNESFPIHSTFYRDTPGQMYRRRSIENTLWDKTTRYGRARWRLAHFMMRRARRIIKQIESGA